MLKLERELPFVKLSYEKVGFGVKVGGKNA